MSILGKAKINVFIKLNSYLLFPEVNAIYISRYRKLFGKTS